MAGRWQVHEAGMAVAMIARQGWAGEQVKADG